MSRVKTILTLPNELLITITAAGQEDRAQTLQPAFKSEWALSHVSRRFRDIIVGTAALWTLIEVDLGLEGSTEILKLYLERSEACSIWATIQYYQRGWGHHAPIPSSQQ
ncbi:hypothetical protein C8F04DRAFT_1265661 [Mycena alexandri]|uniref:F-box domain-containing protein n=1 Tax=Mycena alexandri TaxID=1745969 RepID=A0AAD6WXC3_9AGAR|nr:hypothetical protein C8F04DRAFT_1265661 [Mycena alexandri]